MSTSEETDGLRARYGCKFTLFPAHLEMPAASPSAGKRPRLAPSARAPDKTPVRGTLGVPGLPLATFAPLRQRGCSLIMTSAFYNMAEEREEEGPLLECRTFSTLDKLIRFHADVAHGVSTQVLLESVSLNSTV